MLDVLVIVLFSKQIGRWAAKKGYRGGMFRGLVIASWFTLEIAGAVLGFIVGFADSADTDAAYVTAILLALLGAGTGIMTMFLIVLFLPFRASAESSPARVTKSAGWTCPDCGYLNTSWDKKCFGCKREKHITPG